MKLFNQVRRTNGRQAKRTHGRSFISLLLTLAMVASGTSIGVMLAPLTVQAADSWQTVGTEGFTVADAYEMSLTFNATDTLYVAYRGYQSKAVVKKFDGTNWVTVGQLGFSASNATDPSLAFNSSSTPYVAYSDYSDGNKATVKKFDGTNWVTVGQLGFSAGRARRPSLAINSFGTPYVAYIDYASENKVAVVEKFDGTNWVTVGQSGLSAGSAFRPSLAINASDTPYVAYRDDDNKATVKKFDGTNWVTVGQPGFSTDVVYQLSLAFNSSSTPYVAYLDHSEGGKATVEKFDGTNWVAVGQPGFSAGSAGFTSLAINSSDDLYVAYQDGEESAKATVEKFDGTNWVTVGQTGFSDGNASHISLAINSSGDLYVAYQDQQKLNKLTVKRFGPDITAPTVSTLTPADDATKVAIDTDLTITFSEAVDAETGNITLKNSTGNIVETFDVASSTRVTGSGSNTITINPTANLLYETEYYVQIDATAFDDEASNSYVGITDATTWSFTTAKSDLDGDGVPDDEDPNDNNTDITVPTVESFSPADNGADIAVGSNLVITFSEAVDAETGNIIISKTSGGTVENIDVASSTQVTGSGGNTITINPTADLGFETEYYVQIDATAFDDLASNSYVGIADATTWNFTTAKSDLDGDGVPDDEDPNDANTDITAPTVETLSPADDAIDIAINSDLAITFSEAVDAESGNITISKTSGGTVETFDVASSTKVTGSGTNTITINPTADLGFETEYYVQIDATAFDDAASNSYVGIADATTWSFTTAEQDIIAPVVLSSAIDSTGKILTINWTETDSTPVVGSTGLSLSSLTHGSITLSDITTTGTITTATLSRTLYSDETPTLTYDANSGDFADSAVTPNAVASFSGQSISNSSAETYNAPPTATDDTATTTEDTSVIIDVLVNDTDPEDDTLTISSVDDPVHGTTAIQAGKVTYTPEEDWSGADSFDYTISDGQGNTATATVSVTVSPVNDAPTAAFTADSAGDPDISFTDTSTDPDGAGDITSWNWNFGDGATSTTQNPDHQYEANGIYSVTLEVTDDDGLSATTSESVTIEGKPAGISLSPSTLSLTESDSKNIDFVLNAKPAKDVTITLNTANGDVTLDQTSLTFSPSNWDTQQTVTVTAVDDSLVQGTRSDTITPSVTTNDPDYQSLTPDTVSVTITDDDSAGISIAPLSPNIVEGESADVALSLTSKPTADVEITFTLSGSDASDISLDASTLTFTAGNWSEPQTVKVSASDDFITQGDRSITITPSVTSTDTDYGALDPSDVTVTVTDNDTPGVIVNPTDLNITEGGTASFTAVLNTQPTDTVSVAVSGDAEVSTNKTTLSFTTTNWNTPQTVEVNATDDDILEGNRTGTVSLSFTSSDGDYDNITKTVTAHIADDDVPGVQVTSPIEITEGGGSNEVGITLNTKPSHDVTIDLATSSQFTLSTTTLTIKPSDYADETANTVTITAVDDDKIEGSHTATLALTTTSTDTDYNGLARSATVQITDNDSQGGGGGGVLDPVDPDDPDDPTNPDDEDDGGGGDDEKDEENDDGGDTGDEDNGGDEDDEDKNDDEGDDNTDDDGDFENMSEEDVRDLLAELKVELADLRVGTTTETPVCVFTRFLERGMQGEDVRCLQQTLNAFGFVLAPMGYGSPGNETIYFQGRTFDAVSRYQAANAAEVLTPIGLTAPTGYFGIMTRTELLEDLEDRSQS